MSTMTSEKAPSIAAVRPKTIGLLTSGGDCAGLNAVIRAVVTRAVLGYGWRVYGIRQGTVGLLRRPPEVEELDPHCLTPNLLRMGGTVLGTTNRNDPFAYEMADGTVKDRSNELIEGIRLLGIDALIGVGGDGSFAILRRLAQQGGIDFIGIPKTIDNDVALTESSVGYHTAVAVATEALDRLQPTAASHDRVERYAARLAADATAAERARLRAATVILDPPRSGAGREVVDAIASVNPAQIVYVACDPVALARDLGTFADRGWRAASLQAFDLFPNTHHLEAVARLVPDA